MGQLHLFDQTWFHSAKHAVYSGGFIVRQMWDLLRAPLFQNAVGFPFLKMAICA